MLTAHIHDLVAESVGADGHDVRQIDARRVGGGIDVPAHGVGVDHGEPGGRDAVDLQLTRGQRGQINRRAERNGDRRRRLHQGTRSRSRARHEEGSHRTGRAGDQQAVLTRGRFRRVRRRGDFNDPVAGIATGHREVDDRVPAIGGVASGDGHEIAVRVVQQQLGVEAVVERLGAAGRGRRREVEVVARVGVDRVIIRPDLGEQAERTDLGPPDVGAAVGADVLIGAPE